MAEGGKLSSILLQILRPEKENNPAPLLCDSFLSALLPPRSCPNPPSSRSLFPFSLSHQHLLSLGHRLDVRCFEMTPLGQNLEWTLVGGFTPPHTHTPTSSASQNHFSDVHTSFNQGLFSCLKRATGNQAGS